MAVQSEYKAAQPDEDMGHQWKQHGGGFTQRQCGEAEQPAVGADRACYGGRGVLVLCDDYIHLRVVVDLINQYAGRFSPGSCSFFIHVPTHRK